MKIIILFKLRARQLQIQTLDSESSSLASSSPTTEQHSSAVSSSADNQSLSQNSVSSSSSLNNENNSVESSNSSSSENINTLYSSSSTSSSSLLRDGSSNVSSSSSVASGFSVSDPDYPANMWIDKAQGRYTFSAVQDAQLGGQIVLSTDRNGDGVVYATRIDANGNVVDQKTVPKNSSVNLNDQRQTTINNFDYYGVIDSHAYGNIYKIIYDASDKIRVYLNAKSFIVPKLISQTTSYVDQNNNNIVDEHGKEIKPVVQHGLNGQKYTTGQPKLVNGYYTKHFQVVPKNASGYMSPFYYVGQTVKTFFPDSNVTVQYTLLDYDGNMSGQILDGTQVVASDSKIPKGGVSPHTYLKSNIIYNMRNPYIDQTSNVVYHYFPFGSLLPYDKDTGQPLWKGHDEYKQVYENDPKDYSKALNPYVVNIPGYYPVDTNGNRLTPGKDRYPISDPLNPDKDTNIYYVKDPINVSHEDKTINRNINYVDANGNVVAAVHNDNVTFERNINTDTITGETTQGNWEVKNGNSLFPIVISPVVPGYVLRDEGQKTIPGVTVTPSSSDSNETVTYDKVGSLVPVDTAGNPIDNGSHNTSYPNDNQDAGKITNPVIPNIPGKTPVDKDGNPLTPGSTYPVDGSKPTEDTKITYVDSNQKAKVSYVDQTTGKTLESVDLEGQPQSTSDYRPTDTIKKYTDQGYVVVSNNYPENGVKFNSDNKEQDFTVTLEHKVDTVTPDQPGQPGQPINPDNPNGPKWPNGTDKDSLSKVITRTINYIDQNGNKLRGSVIQKITFTRTAKVDEVTGQVTYSNWTTEKSSFDSVNSPQINGYVLMDNKDAIINSLSVDEDNSDITIDVHYRAVINEHHNNPSIPHKTDQNTSQHPKPKLNKFGHNNNNEHVNKSKLPQTGDSDESNVQVMGLVLLFISSVLSIFTFRKKQSK
ncbi:LPXTG cell wall anchor domain-containing protein [Apilactobacillus kunkeei]|nr:LPXTG cell wall anchor domain-containing protein [Apilactobacillus kunkeei]